MEEEDRGGGWRRRRIREDGRGGGEGLDQIQVLFFTQQYQHGQKELPKVSVLVSMYRMKTNLHLI